MSLIFLHFLTCCQNVGFFGERARGRENRETNSAGRELTALVSMNVVLLFSMPLKSIRLKRY